MNALDPKSRGDRVARRLQRLPAMTRWLLPFCVLVVACSGSSSTPETEAQARGPLDVQNACLAPGFSTQPNDPRLALLAGRWLLDGAVKGESRLLAPDSVGFEISDDGRFRELARNADGALVRRQGFDVEGRIELTEGSDDKGRPAAFLVRAGGYLPFYANVDAGTLHFDGYQALAQLHATDEAPTNHCPTLPGEKLGAAACSSKEASIHFDTSVEETKARLLGRWITCSIERSYGDDPAGYEFTSDGQWFTLTASGARGEPSGTVELLPVDGHAQVNLKRKDGGVQMTHASFSDAPVKLRLDLATAATTIVLAAAP